MTKLLRNFYTETSIFLWNYTNRWQILIDLQIIVGVKGFNIIATCGMDAK